MISELGNKIGTFRFSTRTIDRGWLPNISVVSRSERDCKPKPSLVYGEPLEDRINLDDQNAPRGTVGGDEII